MQTPGETWLPGSWRWVGTALPWELGPLEIMEEDSHGSQVQGGFGASSNVRTISARKTDYTTPKGKGNYCEIREKDKGYITRYLRCPPPSHLY